MSGLKTHRKMIFRVLLLIYLISSVCALNVKVAQKYYQAEENQNQTLEWTFPTKPGNPNTNVFIFCEVVPDSGIPVVLFEVKDGVPEAQKGPFAGRVQCDTDLLRKGRLRLHLSGLTIQDSGLCVCHVSTDVVVGSAGCQLNVTAAVDDHRDTVRPQRVTSKPVTSPPVTLPPRSRHRLYMILPVVVCLLSCVIVLFYRIRFKSSGSKPNNCGALVRV